MAYDNGGRALNAYTSRIIENGAREIGPGVERTQFGGEGATSESRGDNNRLHTRTTLCL